MLEGSVEDLGDAYRAFTLKEIYELSKTGSVLAESLLEDLPVIRENVIRIPYLYFKETDYIYRFRTDKQRNKQIYHIDDSSSALYHSSLCDAIKAVKRAKERSASTPATLDFGAVEYLLPSHFGFCLGVQNAIERAYETIAAHPGRRVFMLSELIHNPFVNEDLKSRGLHYLQSDKGVPAVDSETGKLFWDVLTDEDVVIIPAFGARDEDKVKLIE
ncbi:MAG: 4-hydroxy-3-methylbut-2-enyl diphosphate reductase, partial [Opitutales bacterium]|nr:4-hydroxy-3-methylbut-2-enyl diphosphate reductase [Opitutales bacterium]